MHEQMCNLSDKQKLTANQTEILELKRKMTTMKKKITYELNRRLKMAGESVYLNMDQHKVYIL